MRILYGAGNFIGSNIQAARFIQNAKKHEFKLAGYYRNHRYLHNIDWCLDALYKINPGKRNYFQEFHGIKGPYVHHRYTEMIIDDLLEFQPELVISDCELFTAAISKVLEIPLWYCSPILQINGIKHQRKEINKKLLKETIYLIKKLVHGDRYLVYSPLCDISSRPLLNTGFEWVRPYASELTENTSEENINLDAIKKVIPENAVFCTGETSFVADCLFSGSKQVFITPNPREQEQVLNAQLLEFYGCAKNIGRSENIEYIKDQVERFKKYPEINVQDWKRLDELL